MLHPKDPLCTFTHDEGLSSSLSAAKSFRFSPKRFVIVRVFKMSENDPVN